MNANFYSSSWHCHLCRWLGGCFELLYFLFEHSILIVRKALYRLFMFNYLFRHRRSGFYADSRRYKSEQKKIEQRYTISLFGQLTFWDVNVNNVVSLVTSYQKAYWAFNGVKIWWEEKLWGKYGTVEVTTLIFNWNESIWKIKINWCKMTVVIRHINNIW